MMQTCRMCGARLTDDSELERHNETMHPDMAGKKGGEKQGTDAMPMPPPDRPVD